MDPHATFLSDTLLYICTSSAFTMNFKWSQQTVRDCGFAWSHNWPTSADKAPQLRNWFCTCTKSDVKSLSCTKPLCHGETLLMRPCVFKGGRNNLYEGFFFNLLLWKSGSCEVSFTTSSSDCCSSWSCSWMQKLLMADLAKSSQCHQEQIHLMCCANGICSTKIFLFKICVPDWNLETPWDLGILLP